MPTSDQCPAIDAVMVYKNQQGMVEIAFIQVTLQAQHPIDKHVAAAYFEVLVGAAKHNANVKGIALLYAVGDKYDSFKKQTMVGVLAKSLVQYKVQPRPR